MPVDLAGVCTGPGPCDTHPFSSSTTDNWVARAGGLPVYIRAIAHAQRRHGRSTAQAVALAVGIVKRWAAGQGNVTAATRARAAAALAEWERKRAQARSHSHTAEAAMTVDLAGDPLMRLDKPALIKLAKAVEKWPPARRDPMKRRIAVRARQLGMTPDGDGDFDYDIAAKGASMSEPSCSCRTADLAISGAARKAAPVHYPGTSKFPIRNQHDFDSAWMLRGRSSLPAAAVEKWLRGVAQRFGYKIPGESK